MMMMMITVGQWPASVVHMTTVATATMPRPCSNHGNADDMYSSAVDKVKPRKQQQQHNSYNN